MADTQRYLVVAGGAAVAIRNPASAKENQIITSQGPGTCYLGQTGAVTAATGTPFPPGSRLECLGNGLPHFAVAAATGPPINLTVQSGIGAQ